jgi:Tol biopolymer transport system component
MDSRRAVSIIASCKSGLSLDGRWLAYLSNESGRFELYVVPFPGLNGRWQVSNNGVSVSNVTWSRDDKQLYAKDAGGCSDGGGRSNRGWRVSCRSAPANLLAAGGSECF